MGVVRMVGGASVRCVHDLELELELRVLAWGSSFDIRMGLIPKST